MVGCEEEFLESPQIESFAASYHWVSIGWGEKAGSRMRQKLGLKKEVVLEEFLKEMQL